MAVSASHRAAVMAAIGIRIAVVDDTQPCPGVTVCKSRESCLLGDGEHVPTVTMTESMKIVCTEFQTAHEAAVEEAGE